MGLWVLSGLLQGCANNAGERRGWASAPRHSSGLALDPVQHVGLAIVEVYAARTYGWRGYFAIHPWIIFKRAGETSYTRFDVVGWRRPQVVQRNLAVSDGLWFGATPERLVSHRGPTAALLIDRIEAAIARYPHADTYRSFPGPNSNTFMAHIGRSVPELGLDLPAHAIGKDFRPLHDPFGRSPTGSGIQGSLLGLLGFSVGPSEGLEINVLGLNLGFDAHPLGLRLPFLGRLGSNPESRDPASAPQNP